MDAFVKGMVERPGLCVLAWGRGFKNWYVKRTFSCEMGLLSCMLKIKTEEDMINDDFLWLGRNMPSLLDFIPKKRLMVL